jgi:hypothetical protein
LLLNGTTSNDLMLAPVVAAALPCGQLKVPKRPGSPRRFGFRSWLYQLLVNARVDVIVAAADETVRAVQQATKTIPIVAIVGDMLGPD